jgi:hypothetical protein
MRAGTPPAFFAGGFGDAAAAPARKAAASSVRKAPRAVVRWRLKGLRSLLEVRDATTPT